MEEAPLTSRDIGIVVAAAAAPEAISAPIVGPLAAAAGVLIKDFLLGTDAAGPLYGWEGIASYGASAECLVCEFGDLGVMAAMPNAGDGPP
jgi:hypothetical protein